MEFLPYFFIILLVSALSISSHASSVEDFARLPLFENPKLSPDGSRIAATVVHEGKPLLITRILRKTKDESGVFAIRVGDLHLHDYQWVNNQRLVVSARSSLENWGGKWNIVRMAAVNYDGSDPIFLPMKENRYGYYQYAQIVDPLLDDSKWILAELDKETDGFFGRVHKVNVYSGKKKVFQKNNNEISYWLTDGDGELRIGVKADYRAKGTNVRIFHKAKGKKSFKLFDKSDYFDSQRIKPISFDKKNPDILTYVINSNHSEKKDARSQNRLLAINTKTGELLGKYVEPIKEEILNAAKKAFGDDSVVLISSEDRSRNLSILSVYSDVKPKEYYLKIAKKRNLII